MFRAYYKVWEEVFGGLGGGLGWFGVNCPHFWVAISYDIHKYM